MLQDKCFKCCVKRSADALEGGVMAVAACSMSTCQLFVQESCPLVLELLTSGALKAAESALCLLRGP